MKAFADFFIKMDTDSDGRLNAEEFRASMKKLGDELHGPTAALIFESLDAHGFLDLDQFLAVVEVCNQLQSKNCHCAQTLRVFGMSFSNSCSCLLQ